MIKYEIQLYFWWCLQVGQTLELLYHPSYNSEGKLVVIIFPIASNTWMELVFILRCCIITFNSTSPRKSVFGVKPLKRIGRYFLLSRIFFKLGQRNILFRMFWISFVVQRDSKKLTVRNIFRNGEKLSFTVNNCFWRFRVSCFREIIDLISFPYVFNIPRVTFTLISIWFTLLH